MTARVLCNFTRRNGKDFKGMSNLIASSLGVPRVTRKTLEFDEGLTHLINWGVSDTVPAIDEHFLRRVNILNHPLFVELAVNKIKCLISIKKVGVPTLGFSQDYNWALNKVNAGHRVFCRTNPRGSKGRGIVIASNAQELIKNCPLYTLGFPKTHEFRVHVFNGHVIHYVQKKKLGEKKLAERGIAEANMDVRNLRNGWVFAMRDIVDSEKVRRSAVMAVESLNLNFGAVDVLYNANEDVAVICEINTAPMLMGTTRELYLQAFSEFINSSDSQGEADETPLRDEEAINTFRSFDILRPRLNPESVEIERAERAAGHFSRLFDAMEYEGEEIEDEDSDERYEVSIS